MSKKISKPVQYTSNFDSNNVVNDYAVPYTSSGGTQAAPYHALYANNVALLTSSKNGLKAKAALDFIQLSGFSAQEFQDTFKTTVKTIQNYAGNEQKLDAALSEKLLKSFALFEKGIEIFGSAEAFHQWLMVPAYGLGNQVPFHILDMVTGINLIEEELIRLAYGDLA